MIGLVRNPPTRLALELALHDVSNSVSALGKKHARPGITTGCSEQGLGQLWHLLAHLHVPIRRVQGVYAHAHHIPHAHIICGCTAIKRLCVCVCVACACACAYVCMCVCVRCMCVC